jgi:hypothetical protein
LCKEPDISRIRSHYPGASSDPVDVRVGQGTARWRCYFRASLLQKAKCSVCGHGRMGICGHVAEFVSVGHGESSLPRSMPFPGWQRRSSLDCHVGAWARHGLDEAKRGEAHLPADLRRHRRQSMPDTCGHATQSAATFMAHVGTKRLAGTRSAAIQRERQRTTRQMATCRSVPIIAPVCERKHSLRSGKAAGLDGEYTLPRR